MKSTNTSKISAITDPQWVQSLSDCIAATGNTDFAAKFFSLITQLVTIEQCMIFTYHANDQMDCVMAENVTSPEIAKALANDYVSGEFKKDPNFPVIKGSLDNKEPTVNTLTTDNQHMSSDYLDHFFKAPHLVDKVSLTSVGDSTCYYINLYRGETAGKFMDKEISILNYIAPVISALVHKHFSSESPPAQSSAATTNSILSGLSGRERQICEFILQGYALKTIAAELGISETSAATYRKRAYQKLGIPSKGKLVALFQSRQSR